MKKTINVDAEAIAQGQRLSLYHCPEVIAVRRVVTEDTVVGVDGSDLELWRDCLMNGTKRELIPLPASARLFVKVYDAGWEVEPFTFEVDIPERYLPEGEST